jgi:hypothetical protein
MLLHNCSFFQCATFFKRCWCWSATEYPELQVCSAVCNFLKKCCSGAAYLHFCSRLQKCAPKKLRKFSSIVPKIETSHPGFPSRPSRQRSLPLDVGGQPQEFEFGSSGSVTVYNIIVCYNKIYI